MILTLRHRIADAYRFRATNANSTWLILGKQDAWPDDTNPPSPAVTASSIDAPFYAVKAQVKWVTQDDSGTYVVIDSAGNNVKFLEIPDQATLFATNPLNVFILLYAQVQDTDLNGLGVTFYREIGFSTNLVPTTGHTGDAFLTPSTVSDWGVLESLEYRRPYPVNPGSNQNFYQVIQY